MSKAVILGDDEGVMGVRCIRSTAVSPFVIAFPLNKWTFIKNCNLNSQQFGTANLRLPSIGVWLTISLMVTIKPMPQHS